MRCNTLQLDPESASIYPHRVELSNPTAPSRCVPQADASTSSATHHAATSAHPLGPIIHRDPAASGFSTRLIALVVMAGGIGLFIVAASLTPPTEGIGAHRQLGYAPCSFPTLLGIPCPTCGMTTAFAHAVRGRLISAFHAQPAGLLIALAVAIGTMMAAAVLITGRVWRINWYRLAPTRVAAAIALTLLAAWVYKLATMTPSNSGGEF